MSDAEHEDRMRLFLARHDCADMPLGDLKIALMHRSHAYEASAPNDNERHEFLGDALISAVTSEALFASEPGSNEGALSKRRSRLISRSALGLRAEEMGVGEIILLGRGERETGGARRRSILGSTLEAIVAAIYLSLGFARTRRFVLDHILAALDGVENEKGLEEDHKSALQEWSQQSLRAVPVYTLVSQDGPDHDKSFTVRVELDGKAVALGKGRRIKQAENEAARLALKRIQEEPGLFA